MSQVKIRNTKFVDIDLNFTRHPITGDISKIVDERSIIRSIKNLVRTKIFDKKFHPEISSNIYSLLFEPFTPNVSDSIKKTITNIINNFEPRVELQSVIIDDNPDDNSISVKIQFKIVGTIETITSTFYIKRVI